MIDLIDLSDISFDKLKAEYISNGYRSVVYDRDPETKMGYVLCLMFDKQGQPFNFKYKFPARVGYVVHADTLDVDIYGRNIQYKKFSNSYERTKWIESNADSITVVDCVNPAQDFLTQLFWNNTEDDDFNKQPLRIHTFDIETEISESFEYPYTANNRINMITVYDNADSTFRTWSLQKVDKSVIIDDGKHIVFDEFNSENAMLRHYISWHSENYPDVITGWNIRSYDVPYLIRRIENTLGARYAKLMSPFSQYRIKEITAPENPNNPNSQPIEIQLSGIAQLDELILYKDKFAIKAALSGGYNLSNVGQAEELGDKVKFDGSLRDLYLQDWNKFYTYNVQDVKLVCDIENKYNLIPLARQLVGFGLNGNLEQVYGSISYIIGSLYIFAKKHCNGVVFPTYANSKDILNTSFEGAFVFDCKPGIYTNGIATIDVASLYPNSIRAANISPDTFVGKVDDRSLYDDKSDVVIKLRSGDVKTVNRKTFDKLLNEKCILTKNNTLFFKPSVKSGILPQWCAYYYEERIKAKRGTVIEFNKGNKLAAEALQAKNISLKLLLNSVYGITGSKFCPFFNPDIAQSITKQGRFCNIETEKFIRKTFKEKYGIGSDYVVGISGDTDSLFINIKCITDVFKKKYTLAEKMKAWPDDVKFELWHFVEDFVINDIGNNIQSLLKTECHCEDTSMLGYELEYIGDVGIYQAKKNYGVHKIIAAGPKLVDSAKFVGLEMRKATMPDAIKEILSVVYDNTFEQNWTEEDFRNYIFEMFDKFKTLSVNDVAQWKGYSTAKASVGFLEAEKGATGIAKACQYYNDLIKKLGISKKHEEIRLNEKVRFVYLIPDNQYGINCIAFNDHDWPKEFNSLFQVDYSKMFDKCVLSPLKNFMIAAKYKAINPNTQVLFDISDL